MTSSSPLSAFDRDHVDRMVAAQSAGDHVGAERVRKHLVDEGATDPRETTALESVTRASLLARRMLAAGETGQVEEADRLRAQLYSEFDHDTLRTVWAGMLFSAGQKQGWLPEREYDQLRGLADVIGPDFGSLMAPIRRGRPAGT